MRVVCWVWQILHVPVYDKRLSEDEGEWSDEDEENELEELQTERLIFFYSRDHDAFHYFLSIYVRFGQFTFGPVKFSYVLAQMACKFPIPKSLTKPGLIRGVAFDGSFPYKRGTTVYIFKTEMTSVIIRLLYAMTWFPSALVFVNLRQVLIIWSHLELRGHTVLRSHILNHSRQISLCTF